MATTIAALKKTITDFFVSQSEIQDAYGLETTKTFDEQFSKVSIESILFYIIAYCHKLIYDIIDVFKSEQQEAIDAAVMMNDRWWYNQVMAYVYGAKLEYDSSTYKFNTVSTSSTPLIAYCAIREIVNSDKVTSIQVMCAKSGYKTLSGNVSTPNSEIYVMTEYLNRIKPAGVLFTLESNTPDIIYFPTNSSNEPGIQIYYDPMLLGANGVLLSDNKTYPVNVAIDTYLKGIVYGGKFNVTKMIDAIQSATGVVDVKVNTCKQHRYSDAEGDGQAITTTIDLAAGVATFDITNTVYPTTIGYFPQSAL